MIRMRKIGKAKALERVILSKVRPRNQNGFPYRAQVLERSFAILDLLAESSEDLSLAEIEVKLDFHKSTSYRLLRTLEHHRFAEKDMGTGKYRLGPKLLELGSRAIARYDLATVGRPYLERLSKVCGETANLGILSGSEVVTIALAEGRHALQMLSAVGRKTPVHCSSIGKAILSLLPEPELDAFLRKYVPRAYTRHTITRRADLKAELAQVRKRGFAIDEQELEEGVKCIGAGIRNYSGRVVAGLSIAGPVLRLNQKGVSKLVQLVVRTASEVSTSLGYQYPIKLPDSSRSSREI